MTLYSAFFNSDSISTLLTRIFNLEKPRLHRAGLPAVYQREAGRQAGISPKGNPHQRGCVRAGILFGKFRFVCRLFVRLANVYDCEGLICYFTFVFINSVNVTENGNAEPRPCLYLSNNVISHS
jgi:hypothetical protein